MSGVIDRHVGSVDLFLLYQYKREYGDWPEDMDDFFDGIAVIAAKAELENPPK